MDKYYKHKAFVWGVTVGTIAAVIFLFAWIGLPWEQPAETEREFLDREEAVVIGPNPGGSVISAPNANPTLKLNEVRSPKFKILPVEPVLFKYVQIMDSCGHNFEGECLNMRSGPGTEYDTVTKLRNGTILRVGGMVKREDRTWYKIVFKEWIRYPDRLEGDLYIAADYVRVLYDEGQKDLNADTDSTEKRIVVDRTDQTLYAYEDSKLFMEVDISTGVELSPTPRGEFTIFRKTPSRYMQGPIPGLTEDYWDLPGVPWNLYFTYDGAVIHGAYWHNNFGSEASHGCVNVHPEPMEKLYKWAELGTTVVVRD